MQNENKNKKISKLDILLMKLINENQDAEFGQMLKESGI